MQDNQELNLQDLSPSLQVSIKNIIRDEGFIKSDISVERFDSGGGNFLAELFAVDVKGKTADGEKEANLFVKKKIILNKMTFISINEVFSNEEFAYNDLSKVFTYLQDQANVPIKERYKMAKAYNGFNADALILDNLTRKDFKTYSRWDVIPLKYAELGIKELAKFHGLSFVIEDKMPKYFDDRIKPLKNMFRMNDEWRELVKKIFNHITNCMYKDDDVVRGKIENFFPVMLEKFPKYNSKNVDVKCILTHGDYRINNVLVREQNGIPVEVVPVDYQLIDYGCPIRDFLFFVYSGSNREFRRKNINNLKELYYDTLSKFLRYFDLDVETVYPKKEFERVYKEWLDYALMMMLFASPFLFAPDTGVDLHNIKLYEMPLDFDDYSQNLIREWIEDFIQWGYL